MRRFARPGLETLETRALLSAVDAILPAVASVIAAQGWRDTGDMTAAVTNPNPIPSALTPSQILTAYGFDGSPTAGEGMTIAIVDAYHAPNIQSDLAIFSEYYGLPPASLTVVNQNGKTTGLPTTTDPSWALETALDVEWAHAIAPAADLLLVEASSTSASSLMAAVRTASKSADVVSMSWGGGEWSGQRAYDSKSYFGNPNVTYVAASGDDGGAYGVKWPASSAYVLGVGGTTLSLYSSGAYRSESAWSGSYSSYYGYTGSTGGVSTYVRMPSYQSTSLGSRYASGRVVPDVSIVGNPNTGVSVYNSTPGLGQTGWFQVGGTSAGAPMWAGLIAVADQARAAASLNPLSTSQTLNLMYSLYGKTSAIASSYATSFHDIHAGSNYAGSARAGYDKVTGLGSPIAGAIVAAAASYGATSSAAAPAVDVSTLMIVSLLPHYAGASGQANVSTVIVVTVTITPNANASADLAVVGVLALPTNPAVAPSSPIAYASPSQDVVGRALPNQSMLIARPSLDDASPTSQEAVVLNNERLPAPFARSDEPSTPERGDFLAPPRLVPSSPLDVWDEALTRVEGEADAVAGGPAAFEPWMGLDGAEEDLSESGPTLLGAAGLAAVFWMSWNRRRSESDDDRRFHPAFVPNPSEN